jgi:hypothetical protein
MNNLSGKHSDRPPAWPPLSLHGIPIRTIYLCIKCCISKNIKRLLEECQNVNSECYHCIGLIKLRVVQNDPYSHITSFTIAKMTKLKINFSLAVQTNEEVISLIYIGFVDLNLDIGSLLRYDGFFMNNQYQRSESVCRIKCTQWFRLEF